MLFILTFLLLLIPPSEIVAAPPAQVIVIRHAEKPENGNQLSLEGYERSGAYAYFFQGDPRVLKYGPPIALYAAKPKEAMSSIRPEQTLAPLANALHLTVNTSYKKEEYQQLVQEIMHTPAYAGKTIIISWEHHLIPPLVEAFGVTNIPKKWHGSDYDRLWMITFKENGLIEFADLPEKLMFGDSYK